MNDIISRMSPIIFLISIGSFLRYKEVFKLETVYEIKRFVVNYVLSSFLFITFINIELKKEHYYITIAIFFIQCMFYVAALLLNNIEFIYHPLVPYVTSACAFGFIGMPLFNAIFGAKNIGKLSILSIGHEFYLWLILYTQMNMKLGKQRFSARAVLDLLKTPTVISITLGIIFNISGLVKFIDNYAILKGLYSTLEYLANLSIPLILVIIGYGLMLNKKYMKESAKLLIIRIGVMLIFGYIFKYLLIDNIITYDKIFNYAYFTFLIAPPPLSLPIFIGINSTKEYEELANNLIVLSTIISICMFIAFALLI